MSGSSTSTDATSPPAKTFISLNIDPDGDVYLCSDSFKLLVSSKVLSVASPVFKALFGPHFQEGSQVSTKKPGCVPLSEDNPEAMVVLCQVLHHQSYKVTTKPSFSFLEKAAIIADKYDCLQGMAPWGAIYCTHMLRLYPDGLSAGRLLVSTFLFDDPIGFRAVTKSMVYSLRQSEIDCLPMVWSEEFGSRVDDILPKALITDLREIQHDVKAHFQESIESLFNDQLRKKLADGIPLRGSLFTEEMSHHMIYYSECCEII